MSDQKITITNGKLNVPDNPTIPFIEGDGTGVDIWPASKHVFDSAVAKAYDGKKKINWKEVLAPRRNSCCFQGISGRYQRSAYDSNRRRYPFVKRCTPPDTGFVCMSSPGKMVPGSSVTREKPGCCRHGYLP